MANSIALIIFYHGIQETAIGIYPTYGPVGESFLPADIADAL
jgi:hypothetical protein